MKFILTSSRSRKLKQQLLTSLLVLSLGLQLILAGFAPIKTQAAAAAPSAKVSFTFDDSLSSTYTNAMPALNKYGLKGTVYATTGCIGMTKAPNTCRANTDATYMSWTQLKTLQSLYGWEIGSHTVTHPYLASNDAEDGQPNVLTPAQVEAELANSKAALAAQGINATSFASPYGDYTNATLTQVAKYYSSHRGFSDQNTNYHPYNDYLLNDLDVKAGITVAQVRAKIDAAIANKTWLILTFHDVLTRPSTNPDDYQYSTGELDQIASYVKSKQTAGLLSSPVIRDGIINDGTNLLPNASFNSGLGTWTTDSPTIQADSGTNGSYPDAKNAVKLVAGTQTKHLFSPQVSVNTNTTYILKSFLNVRQLTSGEVAFYIDEYDSNGNWISGQYKAAERSAYIESLNFNYKPSSALVSKARLQIIVTGNSGITAYFDNAQWLTSSTTTPPATTNLVANGTFDQGISSGWSADSANIVADNQSHGSPENVQNSVKLVGANKNTHLFSPSVGVDATKKYLLSSYLNIAQRTNGVVGFYIDEYDTNGNWVSGQYKTDSQATGPQNIGFFYTPSSSAVKKSTLQVIVTTDPGLIAYFDNFSWTLQQ